MRSGRHKRWLVAAAAAGFVLAIARRQAAPALLAAPDVPVQKETRHKAKLGKLLAGFLLFVAFVVAYFAYGAWSEQRENEAIARAITGGDPARADAPLNRYGCTGCHTIPGIAGADGEVAPPLAGLRRRVFIGGVLRNTPANLVAWIVDPQSASPGSAMPVTGISQAEARDVAAYLYAH